MSPVVFPSPPPFASSGSLLVTETSLKPDAAPSTVTLIATSWWFGGHRTLGSALHDMLWADLAIRTTSVFFVSTLPALSVAKYVRVVVPSAVIFTDAWAPGMV